MLPSIRVAGQSIRDALLSTPKNHPYRDIAVAIADLPIPVMSEDRVGNKRSQTDNFYSYDAAFEGQPRINLSMYSKYSTLIHEAVHAFTAESVKRSMLFAIGRRDLASAEGVDPASLNDGAVPMARRLAKAGLIEQWELDSLLTEQSEDARQSALKMAMLKRYVVDVKGDANIRADAGYMAMVEAAIADPKTPAPVRRLLELFKQAKADSDIGATATPNNRLMSPGDGTPSTRAMGRAMRMSAGCRSRGTSPMGCPIRSSLQRWRSAAHRSSGGSTNAGATVASRCGNGSSRSSPASSASRTTRCWRA